MSSDPTTQTSREVIAKAAVERAREGDLPYTGSHSINLESNGSFRSTLPKFFFENTDHESGELAGAYVDLENGLIVLDVQGGDEYER
jgi:hypothetical protein